MDKKLAAEYAQALKDNPLLFRLVHAMEGVCISNIKNNPISDESLMKSSCLMLQCIRNFESLVNRTIESGKEVKPDEIKKVMRIE